MSKIMELLVNEMEITSNFLFIDIYNKKTNILLSPLHVYKTINNMLLQSNFILTKP